LRNKITQSCGTKRKIEMFKLRSFKKEKLLELLKDACQKENIYWTEKKSYPDTDDLVKSNERDEIVSYICEVCERDDMDLSVETFALFVALLDRFLISYKVKSKYLECLAIACLYIASKIKEEDEKISITSDFILDCDSKCSVSELLRMELMVLTKFDWDVNQPTTVDFLYIFHAFLINKYNQVEPLNQVTFGDNKWFKLNLDNARDSATSETILAPESLDFIHILEKKLKQCLCINELTSKFKPQLIALSLLSLQLEKSFGQRDNGDTIKCEMYEMLEFFMKQTKLCNESVDKCKELIKIHLNSIESSLFLFDSYMKPFNIEQLRSKPIFQQPTAGITTQLSMIEEVEEEQDNSSMACNDNFYQHLRYLSESTHTFNANHNDNQKYKLPLSYADIVCDRNKKQRKLDDDEQKMSP